MYSNQFILFIFSQVAPRGIPPGTIKMVEVEYEEKEEDDSATHTFKEIKSFRNMSETLSPHPEIEPESRFVSLFDSTMFEIFVLHDAL